MVCSKSDGVNGLGKVFLAKEKNSGAIIAIKVIWFKNYIENGIQDQIKNEIEVRKAIRWNIDSIASCTQSYCEGIWNVS